MSEYRKLPGRLRGIVRGASVWAGDDHLVAVRSMRFREEYKRFYFRDVQAIAIARQPRFHLSTRAIAIGASISWVWLLSSRFIPGWADWLMGSILAALVIAWIVVSAAFSCTCRIHTAVSRDKLPSVYRIWTARKFFAAVEPLISQVQGVIEGDWSAAVAQTPIGPAHAVERTPLETAPQAEAGHTSATAAWAFVALLLSDALFTWLTLASNARAVMAAGWAFTFLRVGAAIVIFTGRRRAMIRLAVASLICTGGLYYFQQVFSAVRTGRPLDTTRSTRPLLLNQIDIGAKVILGIAGLVILLRSEDR